MGICRGGRPISQQRKHFTFQIFTIGDRTWFKVVDYSLNGTNIADIDPDTVVYPQRLEVLTTFDERPDEVSSKSLCARSLDGQGRGDKLERFKLMLDGAAQLYLKALNSRTREKRKKILATYFPGLDRSLAASRRVRPQLASPVQGR